MSRRNNFRSKGCPTRQEAQAHGDSAQAALGQVINTAMYPNDPANSQVDLNNAQKTYASETAAEYKSAGQSASDFVKGANGVVSTTTAAISGSAASPKAPDSNPGASSAQKAMGAGISTGTKAIKELNKTTETSSAGAQSQKPQQSPSIWQGIKSLFSSTPPPPTPAAPKPPSCAASTSAGCA